MNQCAYCHQYLGTGIFHQCNQYFNPYPVRVLTPIPRCGICGSTAIDHTEKQCKLDRPSALKLASKTSPSKESEKQ